MNDRDVQRILAERHEIAAVILSRGGWLNADRIEIHERFPPEGEESALWRIDLYNDEGEAYHSVYVKAEAIVGISCRRYKQHS